MARSIALLVSLTVALCWAAKDKSHDVWLTRMETPILNEKWIINGTYKLNKVNKNRKSLDLSYHLLQEVNENNLMCEVKVFQKNGGKYVKAPLDFPKAPCCSHMTNEMLFWGCIQARSNAPETCPMHPDFYHLKAFDPDLCDFPKNLPINLAEDYKIEAVGSSGAEQVFKTVTYGSLKKRMQLI